MLFYLLLGAVVVLVPAMTDRLLKGRVADGLRFAVGFFALALTAAILALVAPMLGL